MGTNRKRILSVYVWIALIHLQPAVLRSASLEEWLASVVSGSRTKYYSTLFRSLGDQIIEDTNPEPTILLGQPRPEWSVLSKKGVKPWETLVITVIPHDKQFPGPDQERTISREGIPTIALSGPTPEKLKEVLKKAESATPPFKKIHFFVSSHGLAVDSPDRKRPDYDHDLVPRELRVEATAGKHAPMFADYLRVLLSSVERPDERLEMYLDTCFSSTAQEDLLRMRREIARSGGDARTANVGLVTSTLSTELADGASLSEFERRMADVFIHGGAYDSDGNGVIDARELMQGIQDPILHTNNQIPQANPYVQIPVIATGSEAARSIHQWLNSLQIYRDATDVVRTCRRGAGTVRAPSTASGAEGTH